MPTIKQKRYKTAYSPLFACYVTITHVYDDADGDVIFVGENKTRGIENHLFREHELEKFCL